MTFWTVSLAIGTCAQTHTQAKIFKINIKTKVHAYTQTYRSIGSLETKMMAPFSML